MKLNFKTINLTLKQLNNDAIENPSSPQYIECEPVEMDGWNIQRVITITTFCLHYLKFALAMRGNAGELCLRLE